MKQDLKELKRLSNLSSVTKSEYPDEVKETYRGIAIVEDEDNGFTSRSQIDAYLKLQEEVLMNR